MRITFTSFYRYIPRTKFSKILKQRGINYEKVMSSPAPTELFIDRLKFEDLLKRRFYYDQSFAIYGGVSGLYDFGPMGCALKNNMIQYWRKHFIIEEGMLEVECTSLTPSYVLKASGHVDRFIDWMVKDVKTSACFRADHLIKNQIESTLSNKKTPKEKKPELEQILAKLDGLSCDEMDEIIRKYKFKSPITGNELTPPTSFNLMFPTEIGPGGELKAFLRPETAQGIFINFKRLLEFNQGKLPFAAAQVGSGFRNEISPRQGLIRVREFTMCEIEHFVDPVDKKHPKFSQISQLEFSLFDACSQVEGTQPKKVKIGEAVSSGLVNNETLGYYMARTYLFLVGVGIDPEKLRFRQHLSSEMAHYAKDCWDAECLTSYGWIECVGNADRACYDLLQHSKATGVRLAAEKALSAPKQVQVVEMAANKQAIGKQYKSDSKDILGFLKALSDEEIEKYEKSLKADGKFSISIGGKEIILTSDVVEVRRFEKTVHVEDVVPSVIEPSFGIGRIMYALLEHAFRHRLGDEQRNYLDIAPTVAPIKCSILPISQNERLTPIISEVRKELAFRGISYKIDDSAGSIGRRYARTDEIGVPFGITVDFESEAQPHTVTLRHAPTMKQVRLKVSEVSQTIDDLVDGRTHWIDVLQKFPLFNPSQETTAD